MGAFPICPQPVPIKLGRKHVSTWIPGIYHWAIKVGDNIWYEIVGKGAEGAATNRTNEVRWSQGYAAHSSAGYLGGQFVGETSRSCDEIYKFIEEWLTEYPHYSVYSDNCQKFAYEFIRFLTNGLNFRLPNRFDAAYISPDQDFFDIEGLFMRRGHFEIQKDGINISRWGSPERRVSLWYLIQLMVRGPSLEAAAVYGRPGLGAWLDASFVRLEFNWGPLLGLHIEPSLNTGLGLRDGYFDVHVAGFGIRLGCDAVELDLLLPFWPYIFSCCGVHIYTSALIVFCAWLAEHERLVKEEERRMKELAGDAPVSPVKYPSTT